jgi:histidyl-tRNA synthetase
MRYQSPRGTHDILPDETPRWRALERRFTALCQRYGYREIRTPLFEQTDLFARTVGETSDLVTKQMYTFEDPGGDRFTLRAEGTAPALRAYLEHSLAGQSPLVKLSYICPIFRYERPQAGRYRQHHQVGIEVLGSSDPAVDAEVIAFGAAYLADLGITGYTLKLNSVGCPDCRPNHRDALRSSVRQHLGDLCADCQRRFDENPLRMLDCKRERCRELLADAPGSADYLCDECSTHFARLRALLAELGIGYELDSRLVRGLDYYTKTAFEFMHTAGLGAQSAIIGGGRYDGLVEECGGKPTPGIGFGSGIERVLLVRQSLGVDDGLSEEIDAFVITLGDTARVAGLRLLAELRAADLSADTDYLGRSLKSQMKEAHRQNARFALIAGEDEIARGVVAVRNMQDSEQTEVPMSAVVEHVKSAKAESEVEPR